MSRTLVGSKSAGYDYWSRRPGSGKGFGPSVKKACLRTERQQRRRIAAEQLVLEDRADAADDAYEVYEYDEIERVYGDEV